jgi:hypothetical protein
VFGSFFVTGTTDVTPSINPLSVSTASGLSQSVASYYGSAFTLTVKGQSFGADAVVLANGASLQPGSNSGSQITVSIPASSLALVGPVDIAVQQKQNSGSNNLVVSNTAPLRVVERGDIDGNRTITNDDAIAVALNAGGLGGDSPFSLSAADFNLNGGVNVGDALTLGLFANGSSQNLPDPGITSASPFPAVANQTLTINGTGFPSASADLEVAFTVVGGMIQRVPVVLNPPGAGMTQSTSLTVTVPQNAISGPIQIYRLDSPAGSQPFELDVTGIPSPLLLTAITPLQAAAGSAVTLSGSGFTNPPSSNTVWFSSASGPVSGAVTGGTSTSLTVTVPNQASCGGVTVANAAGTSNVKPFIAAMQACALSLTGMWSAGSTGKIVLIEGTGFSPYSPQSNVVRFQTGTGTAIAPVVQSGSTELDVRIPDNAIPGGVTVTVGATTSNAIAYQPSPPPVITRITANSDPTAPVGGARNSAVPIVITGSNYVPGGTTLSVTGGTGVTIGILTVTPVSVSTTLTIAADATIADRSVSVVTSAGTSNSVTFSVYGIPTITSVTPPYLGFGISTPLTMTGTGFVKGHTLLAVAGGGTAPGTVNDATSLAATLQGPAVLGARGITAMTSAGTSAPFTVTVNGLGNMTPQGGFRGQSFPLDLTGCFVPGQTVITASGTGVTITDVTVGDDPDNPSFPACAPYSTAKAIIHIAIDAAPGNRSISVTTPAGTIPSTVNFTVQSFPSLISITPNAAPAGTNTVALFGAGFSSGPVTVDVDFAQTVLNLVTADDHNLQVQLPTPTIGQHNINVEVGGNLSQSVPFTALGALTVSTVSPNVGFAGGPMFLTLTGANFAPGTTIDAGTGITVSNISVSPNFGTLTATLTIAANATTGVRTLHVKASATSPIVNVNITINPPPAAPTLTNISPAAGPQNGFVTVTLTGTNFINGGTVINFSGTGVTVSNINFASATSITAFLTLSDPGNQNVSVTTAGGTSATVPFAIVSNPIDAAAHFNVSHFAGSPGGDGRVDGTGSAARFSFPEQVWTDGTNVYVADNNNHTIRKVVIATGVVTTVAGLPGTLGTADGVGTAARFNGPVGVWGDGTNLYVTDTGNHTIRKIVLATGAVTTFAGTAGVPGATPTTFNFPQGLCGDGTNLYVADTANSIIRKIVISNVTVTTIAGVALSKGAADGTTLARFSAPTGIFCDGTTNLYIADTDNHNIRKIALNNSNLVSTVAGTSTQSGTADGTGGTSGTARFNNPGALWGDGTNLFVADGDNNTIRQVAVSNGQTSTLSGLATIYGGADGTGGPGGTARFARPVGLWGAGSNLYVADNVNYAIRVVSKSSGAVTTLAGAANSSGNQDGIGTAALFSGPQNLWGDPNNLYIADTNNARIRTIALSNQSVSTLVGQAGSGHVDGIASLAKFANPNGIWDDGLNLYIADNPYVRKTIKSNGTTSTYQGTGAQYLWGTGANLYIDQSNEVDTIGIPTATPAFSVLAGNLPGFQDGTGTNAEFQVPAGVWGDGTYLYIADSGNNAIRKVRIATQEVTTFAGDTNGASGSNNGPSWAARFNNPSAIWGDRSNLYVVDSGNNAIRRISLADGTVTTIAGGHYGSDDALDSLVGFSFPTGIWGNGSNLYVTDSEYSSVRKLSPVVSAAPTLSSIAGTNGSRNTTVAVTLIGTNFIPGATSVSVSGTGVTVSSVTVTGPGTLLANFTIASGTATGARNVTVTTSAGTSAPMTFTVN